MQKLPPCLACPQRLLLVPTLTLMSLAAAAEEPLASLYLQGNVTRLESAEGLTTAVRGEIREFLRPPLLSDPAAPLLGHFARRALPDADLRTHPDNTSFTAPDGTLTASPVAVRRKGRIDLVTGRPLAYDAAADATCATGAEVDCLAPGTTWPANRTTYDAMCYLTKGFYALDLNACSYDIFRSMASPLPGASVAQILGQFLAGSPSGIAVASNPAFLGPASGLSRMPLVALSMDATDGTPTGFFSAQLTPNFANAGANPARLNHNNNQTLAQVLTVQQQTLQGCGPVHGDTCDGAGFTFPNPSFLMLGPGGLNFLYADAAALLQAFAPIADESFLATDATIAQPGTLEAPAPGCTRHTSGGSIVVIPGCRGPSDAAVDGPDPSITNIGFPAGQGATPVLGSAVLGPIAFTRGHPFTGQTWRSEMAALSWNLQMILVATSPPPSSPTRMATAWETPAMSASPWPTPCSATATATASATAATRISTRAVS